MKKLPAVILALAIIFTLSACEEKPNESAETAETTSATEVTTAVPAETTADGKKIYLYTNGFFEGRAAVLDQNEKWGFVDEQGNEIVPAKYDDTNFFINGLAKVEKDGKCGYINADGEEVIPLIYSRAYFGASEGLLAVGKDGENGLVDWGYIDTDGNTVIPFEFEEARNFNEGLAGVKVNGKWGYIDRNGEIVIDCVYDDADRFYQYGDMEYAIAENKIDEDSVHFYVIDRTGEVLFEKETQFVHYAGDGIIKITNTDDTTTYTDLNGNVIAEFNDYGGSFNDGVCVLWNENEKHLKVIDNTGKIMFEKNDCIFAQTGYREGLLIMAYYDEYRQTNNVFVDINGNEMLNFSDNMWGIGFGFSEGLSPVAVDGGGCGYVDRTGELVIQPKYRTCNPFFEGYACVQNGEGDCCVINRNEEVIIRYELSSRDYSERYEY